MIGTPIERPGPRIDEVGFGTTLADAEEVKESRMALTEERATIILLEEVVDRRAATPDLDPEEAEYRRVVRAQVRELSNDGEGLLTPEPFDEAIEFDDFDFWHYYGRTAKHGAFMGGADFVQWHGNYELLVKMTEMRKIAQELRARDR